MATTAQNIIDGAMSLLRVFPPDSAPSSSEYADGLSALNNLLDLWGNRAGPLGTRTANYSGSIPSAQTDTGFSSLALFGTGISSVDTAAITSGGYRYPLAMIDLKYFDSISSNTANTAIGSPFFGYLALRHDISDTFLHFYPAPGVGTIIFVRATGSLPKMATIADQIPLAESSAAPGMRLLLLYALARELAPMWQTPQDPQIESRYRQLVRMLKIQQKSPHCAQLDPALPGLGRSNILTGL